MRGLKKKKASEYVPAKAVPFCLDMITVLHAFMDSPVGFEGFSEESRWKDVTLRQTRCSVVSPDTVIEYGTYALFNCKMAVAEGRMYNLRHMFKDELAINAYLHLCNWVDYASQPLNNISKKVLKTNDAATGYEKVGAGWGKKMSEQVFIYLLNCSVRGLDRDGKEIPGYVSKHWTNSWFTSHTFRCAGTKYRFMYAQHARRWSLCMINWWAGWGVSETTETLVRLVAPSTLSPTTSVQDGFEDRAEEELPKPPKTSGVPAVQDWANICLMWWIPDKSLHLFKPLSMWTLAERTNAGYGSHYCPSNRYDEGDDRTGHECMAQDWRERAQSVRI
ncbi:hypothetical protein PPTG_18106 [Phytophthora nicotianae INRA-310]|uniref:Uncharacterized protein n=1 Tax=Phytophthora nicotianae (strain INRA-310) TaxID=761204 RepID=W2PJL1_PHYN3|nr:hypothetical protein PPTG_18106 [Phytophthora nicotianae INRA-310]ETN00424.1 hypothetical protein PPTG_18106 [Phytophthora nicotianae INRA-310]